MKVIFKTLIKYYLRERCFGIAFFIKGMVLLILVVAIISCLNINQIAYGEIQKVQITNRIEFVNHIFLIVILMNFSLGFMRDLNIEEIVPFLNFPIKRSLLLIIFILRSYFDFPFSFYLLLNLLGVLWLNKLFQFELVDWISSILVYSILFQQIGILTRMLKMSVLIKLGFVLALVICIFFLFREGARIYSFSGIIKLEYVITFGLILFSGILYYSKNQLFNRLVDYL